MHIQQDVHILSSFMSLHGITTIFGEYLFIKHYFSKAINGQFFFYNGAESLSRQKNKGIYNMSINVSLSDQAGQAHEE